MNSRDTLKINQQGHLEIGGIDSVELAKCFGTPLYVMDKKYIADVSKSFLDTIINEYGEGTVAYASKAFSSMAIYKMMESLGLSVDVVSGGEFYCALKAGFNPERVFFHGNNKLNWELELAISNGVGVIVMDNADDVELINEIAKKHNRVQKVLLRVNPGVEAHTHSHIQTARPDSKFGIAFGQEAEAIMKNAASKSNVKFFGLHCHIGSQIFEKSSFELAVEVMTDYIKKLKDEGIEIDALNLGGGFGITYTEEDPQFSEEEYCDYVKTLVAKLTECVNKKGIKKPFLVIEPGRSIVGEAGVTLYTVGAIKDIKNIRKYVAIDGGMFDNPRYALYEARYSAVLANKANLPKDDVVSIAGKCCESGDLIGVNMPLQKAERGDLLAVFSTGAYNYSMSSNYNSNFVPPVVLVDEGKADYIVKPQTLDDLIRNNAIPKWL